MFPARPGFTDDLRSLHARIEKARNRFKFLGSRSECDTVKHMETRNTNTVEFAVQTGSLDVPTSTIHGIELDLSYAADFADPTKIKALRVQVVQTSPVSEFQFRYHLVADLTAAHGGHIRSAGLANFLTYEALLASLRALGTSWSMNL